MSHRKKIQGLLPYLKIEFYSFPLSNFIFFLTLALTSVPALIPIRLGMSENNAYNNSLSLISFLKKLRE